MTLQLRRLLLCLIGLLAGLLAWSWAESLLLLQPHFPSYLIFNLVLGLGFGGLIGACFGAGEGILWLRHSQIMHHALYGLGIGALGGGLAFLIAQGIFFVLGEQFLHSSEELRQWGLPLSRAMGWAILGSFVGMADGFRSRSTVKLKIGVLGGVLGGSLGGLVVEYLPVLLPDLPIARLLGLLALGTLLGAAYGLVESRFAQGLVKVLNGASKGKEFLIVPHTATLGSSPKADIPLVGYNNISPTHAIFERKENSIVIKKHQPEHPIMVNETLIDAHPLKLEDVLQIGSAKLLFLYK